MVNSTGIAVDPTGTLYPYGGEVQTPPHTSPEALGAWVTMLADWLQQRGPQPLVNYRSNLHIHVRVPGLREHLPRLKHLAQCNRRWLPALLPVLEPIPQPTAVEYPDRAALRGAKRRARRRRVSHQTVLSATVLERQLLAQTPEAFFQAEPPRAASNGVPLWHLQPRAAVNVRQLLQTDTIEFRHFPGTTSGTEVGIAAQWCVHYLHMAFNTKPDAARLDDALPTLLSAARSFAPRLPTFHPYQHHLEAIYLRTCHDGTVPRAELRRNIAEAVRHLPRDDRYDRWATDRVAVTP